MESEQPVKRPRGRPSSFSRERFLEAALLLFWRDGYEAVSFEQLVGKTGASRRAVYAAFPNKEALFGDCLVAYKRLTVQLARERASQGTTPEAVILGFVREALDMALAEGGRGCFLQASLSVRAESLDIGHEYRSMLLEVTQCLADRLAELSVQPTQARLLSETAVLFYQGVLSLARSGEGSQHVDRLCNDILRTIISKMSK